MAGLGTPVTSRFQSYVLQRYLGTKLWDPAESKDPRLASLLRHDPAVCFWVNLTYVLCDSVSPFAKGRGRAVTTWGLKSGGSQQHISGVPWRSPAHFRGGIEKLHFVAAVTDEQEELLGERRVPDHTGRVGPLVRPVNVQDFQVVFVALDKVVLYLQRRTGGRTKTQLSGSQPS